MEGVGRQTDGWSLAILVISLDGDAKKYFIEKKRWWWQCAKVERAQLLICFYYCPLLEQVVADIVVSPSVIGEEFAAGYKKSTPSSNPCSSIAGIILFEQLFHFLGIHVHSLQPCLQRQGVMDAIHPPLVLQNKIFLKVQQQIVRGQCSAFKKIFRHPIFLWFYHVVGWE